MAVPKTTETIYFVGVGMAVCRYYRPVIQIKDYTQVTPSLHLLLYMTSFCYAMRLLGTALCTTTLTSLHILESVFFSDTCSSTIMEDVLLASLFRTLARNQRSQQPLLHVRVEISGIGRDLSTIPFEKLGAK